MTRSHSFIQLKAQRLPGACVCWCGDETCKQEEMPIQSDRDLNIRLQISMVQIQIEWSRNQELLFFEKHPSSNVPDIVPWVRWAHIAESQKGK